MADARIRAVITAEDRASQTLKSFSNNLGGLGDFVEKWGKRAAIAVTTAVTAFATLGVKTAADLEAARMGFVTLLGSAEAADKTMARIKKEAARTPFEVPGLTAAVQMLSAVTKDGDRAIDIILDVGEGLAAMGRGQAELDRISVNLQQIAALGKATSIDIKQFAFAGIPIYEMLQKQIGLTGDALEDFISEGGVTFDLLADMFDKANDEGGRFFDAFKNQMGTFDQQWSNFKDTLKLTAADIVRQTGLFDALKAAMAAVSTVLLGLSDNVIKPVMQWIRDNGPAILNVFRLAWEQLQIPINVLVGAIREHLWPSLVQLWETIKPAVPLLGIILVEATKALIQILTAAVLIISNLINWFHSLSQTTSETLFAIRNFTLGVANWFGDMANNVVGFIGNIINWIGNLIKAVDNGINKIPLLGRMINLTAPPHEQMGGPVRGNSPYIVGERGPELFVPGRSGRIISNDNMPRGGGGGNVSLSVNIGMYAGTPLERRKIAAQLYEDLKDVANAKGITLESMIARG